MVANRIVREQLVRICVKKMIATVAPRPGLSLILDDPDDCEGAVLLRAGPKGRKCAYVGAIGRQFGEADIKTFAWLAWMATKTGKSTIGVRHAGRTRVLLTSVDSDMALIAALHTELAVLKAAARPCHVLLMPGGGKRKKVPPLRDVDQLCAQLRGQGQPAQKFEMLLNNAWAILICGCDFVRGLPRLDLAAAMAHSARLRPITVETKANAARLTYPQRSAAADVAASYPNLGLGLTTPESILTALREKYKRCAATERDAQSASGMLRAAFWVVAGYWLRGANGELHRATDRKDHTAAADWGFLVETSGKVFHCSGRGKTTIETVVSW